MRLSVKAPGMTWCAQNRPVITTHDGVLVFTHWKREKALLRFGIQVKIVIFHSLLLKIDTGSLIETARRDLLV